MKRNLLLTLAVLLGIGAAWGQTDRWIFPLVFTDATNNPDTVWFIQYNNEVTTLETILQEEGINPDVDTTRFHVYFTDSNGIKTRIATRQFSGNFNDVKLEAGLCEFPIQASWDKNLLSLSSELFGPITYSTIKSLYTEICSVDGGAPTDDDDLWANIFSMMDSTGQQPAAYYSENGAFYGDDGMLSWFLDSFFPMYVTLTREHFHHGNIGGFTAAVNGHDVTLNWVYFQGCEHLNYFTILRLNSSETELLANYTTTEMTFTETDVPAGTYIYSINGVFSDGTYVYDDDPFLSVICTVTIEPAETEKWIFPIIFTDGSNASDTVWFVQHADLLPDAIDEILQNQHINPAVDTTKFCVYFTQADGTKTRVAIAPFTGEFNARKLNAGHCEFPVQLKWNKNLVEVPCEPYGAVTYSTIESEYIGIYSVEGWTADDDYDPWGNIFSYIDSTGPQPAACYSEYGQYYGEEDMLQPLCESFFPMYITITRKHFHSGNIHGLTASTNGHNVILNWNYGGCEHIDRFEVYRATLGGTILSNHTTTETHFEEENVPAGQYEYMIDGYFTDGSHIYDPILYNPYPSVTVEVQDDTVSNTFAPATAEWYFGLSSFMGGPMSYYKMEVLGDTVVQGHNCSIITAPYIGGNGGNQYVYEENNVVYWYNATTDAFTILYNFNANVGDSWICDIDTCSYQVTVTSIDSVTWGGRTYRVQNVTSDWNIMEGKIIDGIGYEGGLFPYMWACSYEIYDGTYPYYLRCYLEDGEMLYHEGSYDCNAVIEIDPFSYEAVLKPDADSISWIAWSRDTEEDIMQQTLYVKREADSIYLYKRSEISEETNLVGTLHEEGGRLWIKYRVYNIIEDVYYYYDVLVLDMTLNIGDNFVLPTGVTATVADVYYREGRKVIVFDSTMYSGEWKEPLMFIEGVGPNFISTDGPTEIYQNYISCKFEDGNRVYSTQNILFSECDYNAEIIAGQDWYYEFQNPDGSTTYQHLYYLADTTIREKNIDIIVRTNTLYDKGTNTTHEYIYEEEGKVFWWNATIDDFTTLYDFTAMPGDEWEIKVGTESITMHVDAVGEMEYNSKIFKTLHVSDAGDVFSGTIVAKVGHLTSFFPEKLMRKSGESTVEGLRCLWNGTELVFKYGDKDCDEIYEQLHYGLKDVETEALSLYPNPTEGVLTVETQNFASPQKQTTYRILNLMGQTLLEGRTEGRSTRIDVSDLSDGMYFINIEGATQKFVIKK